MDMKLEVVIVPVSDVNRADGLQLVVTDIEAARAGLTSRGAEMSEVFHDAGGLFHHGGTEGGLLARRRTTISTDNILKTNEFRTSVGAQWTFLSDAGHKIAKDLGIAEYTDPYYDPMIPYTLVLKRGWSSTASTTATGSGAGRRSRTLASMCAR
jgi:hypothetical protein